MEAGKSKCRHCGAVLGPGCVFCEICGNRAEQDSASAAEPENAGPDVLDPAPPFCLSAALPQAMLAGLRSAVYIGFRACKDIYDSVKFVLRNGTDELAVRRCCDGRPLTANHCVSIDVVPERAGSVRLALDVVCGFESEQGACEEVHTAFFDIVVEDANGAAPVININQTQTSDRAGDTKGGSINVVIGGENFVADKNPDYTRYAADPAALSPVPTRLRTSPARLTLKAGNVALQLISDATASFGRQSDNTVPLRIYGPDGRLDVDANKYGDEGWRLSRYQFRIAVEGSDCMVYDGGAPASQGPDAAASPSSFGTFVNGRRARHDSGTGIPAGIETVISAGPGDARFEMRAVFLRDGMNRPLGVRLTRTDGAAQTVCIVCRSLPLESGCSIAWTGGRWMLCREGSVPETLNTGGTVRIGGTDYGIYPFHSTHI